MSSKHVIRRQATQLDREAADKARTFADVGICTLPLLQWAGLCNLSGDWATASGIGLGAATLVCAGLHNRHLRQSDATFAPHYQPSEAALQRVQAAQSLVKDAEPA
jgi:hypothetical protein